MKPSLLHIRTLMTVPRVLSGEEINDAKAKDVMLSLHLKATMMKARGFGRALQSSTDSVWGTGHLRSATRSFLGTLSASTSRMFL